MKKSILLVGCLLGLSVGSMASAQPRTEIHFPDLPGYRTLKCDFHMHTVFSDGLVWPAVRVDEAWREGLDVIAITDHIEYQPHRDDLPTKHNRPYEIVLKQAEAMNILLIRGAEVTRDTPPGHFNAIFLEDINPLDTEDFFDVFNAAGQQDAFVFWNHPDWKGLERGKWAEAQQTLWERKQLHGVEVYNEFDYHRQAHQYAVEKGLTMLGNSDIHVPARFPHHDGHVHRTLTLVFAKERTIPAVREALFAGRTIVWGGDLLIGREELLAPFFAACVTIDPPHRRSDDRVWVRIHNHCAQDLTLERVGEGKPALIDLPAQATSLVRFDLPGEAPAEPMSYRVKNLLIGPDEPLTVQLEIPAPGAEVTAPAPITLGGSD